MNVTASRVDVWVVPLAVPPAAVEALLAPEELERAAAFVSGRARHRYVAARAALRALLAAATGIAPAALQLGTGRRGKPRLTGSAHDVRFSLSRSEDLAVVALTVGREVGVDVERIAPTGTERLIAERLLPAEDASALRRLEGRALEEAFFARWCRNEARVKAAGVGLTAPLPAGRWTVWDLDVAPGHAAAVAVEGDRLPTDVRAARWHPAVGSARLVPA